MSEFLAAAASTMNVPEALVQRSAEARSKATGASTDEILQAWAGGGSAPAAAPAPAAAEAQPAEAQPAEPESVAAAPPAAPAAQGEAVSTAPSPTAVAVLAEPEEAPVEPVSLRERTRLAGRVGMGFGVVAAVFIMVFSAQWLLPRAGVAPSETDEITFVFSVVAGSLTLGSALIGAAVGAAGAAVVRGVTGWRSRGMRLVSSHTASVVVGAAAGLVVGALIGSTVAGSGTADPLDETVTLVPMLPSLFWTLFGWVAGGWLIGTLVQALGVPDGLAEGERVTGTAVQGRLAAAFSLPVLSVLSILVVVLPAAWVFIQFPSWAPFIAIFIAGGIIAFASLSAARPGMRISAGEFLVAAAGIGVVVLIVASVLATQGGGGHAEDDDHAEETSEEAAVVVVVH